LASVDLVERVRGTGSKFSLQMIDITALGGKYNTKSNLKDDFFVKKMAF
jgi:hypothetical protein